MVDFREIIAVEGLYIPQSKNENYAADILVKRGEFLLLIRYPYSTKGEAKRAVEAFKRKDKLSLPEPLFTPKVYMVDTSREK